MQSKKHGRIESREAKVIKLNEEFNTEKFNLPVSNPLPVLLLRIQTRNNRKIHGRWSGSYCQSSRAL